MTIQISPPAGTELQNSHALWLARYPEAGALIDKGTPPPKVLRYLGLTLWRDGRLDDAAGILTTAAILAPDDPQILGDLGCLLSTAGRKAEAMDYMIASLRLDPNQTQVWLNVAVLCKEAGDRVAAEQAFLEALTRDPDSPEAAAGLGLLYMEWRRLEEAVRLLRAAIERGITVLPVYACLGQALYLLGDFSNASVAFEKAAQFCPDEVRIVQKCAQARLIDVIVKNSVAEAIDMYRTIAGRYAEDMTAVCRTAFQALCGYGPSEAAIRMGEALLKEAPDDPILQYELDAQRGRALEKAPANYLTACFDKFAPNFDRHLVEVLDYRLPGKLHPILVETGLPFTRILDLGCGTGLAAPYLSSFGGNLTGVDISPRMLDKARERNLYAQLIEDEAIAYLSGGDEQFDLIVALDVLVYFGDLTAMLAAAAARLAPSGVFAFSFETGQCADYTILPSGRFAHDPAYVERISKACFTCIGTLSTTQRLEVNRPVDGHLVLLQRAAPASENYLPNVLNPVTPRRRPKPGADAGL